MQMAVIVIGFHAFLILLIIEFRLLTTTTGLTWRMRPLQGWVLYVGAFRLQSLELRRRIGRLLRSMVGSNWYLEFCSVGLFFYLVLEYWVQTLYPFSTKWSSVHFFFQPDLFGWFWKLLLILYHSWATSCWYMHSAYLISMHSGSVLLRLGPGWVWPNLTWLSSLTPSVSLCHLGN